jgi:hypothetical protein
VCFHPQVRGCETPTPLGLLEIANLSQIAGGRKRPRASGNIDIFIDLPLLLLPSLHFHIELDSLQCLEPITIHLMQGMESHLCEPITDLGFSFGVSSRIC